MNFFLFIIYCIVAVTHIAGEIIEEHQDKKRMRYYTKPILMPSLLLYYLLSTSQPVGWIIGGIICGFLGDVLLMFPRKVKPAFLGGIGAFLLGQIMYLGAFLYATSVLVQTQWWVYLTLPLLIGYGVLIFFQLKGTLGSMKIPVIAYLVVILTMMFGALTLIATPELVTVQTPWITVVGASCFIISDTVNAWEKFKKPFPYIRAIIMTTYLIAQLFIIQGFL